MSEFQREHRYWVIKRKHLTPEQDEACRQFCGRLRYEGVPDVEAVVVESDWLIYDAVWDMIQRGAEGRPQRVTELVANMQAVHNAASQLMMASSADEADEALAAMNQAIADQTGESLNALILNKQAEVLERVSDDNNGMPWLRGIAEKLRQQAKEATQ